MKLNGSDPIPVAAIAVGAFVGVAFSMSLRTAPEGDVRVQVAVERAAPQAGEAVADETVGHILGARADPSAPRSGEPLVYIDGIRMAAGASLDDIDPDAIERIEVVKGAAAIELYGVEASVGVVQIFLKVTEER